MTHVPEMDVVSAWGVTLKGNVLTYSRDGVREAASIHLSDSVKRIVHDEIEDVSLDRYYASWPTTQKIVAGLRNALKIADAQ